MNEIWKPIKGFEDKYEVSNYGRVKSLNRTTVDCNGNVRYYKGRLLKLKPNKVRGYTAVRLYKNGKVNHIEVHRLVGIHFIPNPDNLPVINHLNTIRHNNHVDNLEWCSYGENIKHKGAFRKGREKMKKKVFQYSLDGDFIRTWNSATDIENSENEFKRSGVCHVCNGTKPTYKGFVWSYE